MLNNKNGEPIECLVLPINQNHLFKSEKGNIYIDLVCYELKSKTDDNKDTHIIKQSLPKEVYDSMTDEQKRQVPIIGSMRISGGVQEPAPNMTTSEVISEVDDLPF